MVVASSQAVFLSEVSEEDSEELAEDEVTPDETVEFVQAILVLHSKITALSI